MHLITKSASLILKVSNDFAFGLFDLDWDVFSAHVDGAVHRVPVIGETGVKSTVCGPGIITQRLTNCYHNSGSVRESIVAV